MSTQACHECDGEAKCPNCHGSGDDPEAKGEPCPDCGGDGECNWCDGTGIEEGEGE